MTQIVLHMGQSKTGTTALQAALHRAAPALRRAGVVYPRFPGRGFAHHLLLPLCEDPNRLPAWYLHDLGGPERAAETAWQAWNATCDAVLRRPPPVIVLSSELLVHHTRGAAKARLASHLSELSQDIAPVIYIRHPVDHYRARLQEWLKTESRPFPPTRLTLREAIGDSEAAFGRPPVLVAFDRSGLHGGDITTDFVTRFLHDRVQPADVPTGNANAGLSAEALVLLAHLRAEGGNTPEAARQTARLVPPLARLDLADPPGQPLTLLPEVATAALRAATCHRWLVETGRLVLPGLHVAQIDGAPVPDWLMTALPHTLFSHDPDRLQRLWQSLEARHPQLLKT